MKFRKTNSEKEKEEKIREHLKNVTETLVKASPGTTTIDWLNTPIQAYTTYINYKSQERSLKQIRITALATVALASATFILAMVTWLHA
jgi:hypothetical protein